MILHSVLYLVKVFKDGEIVGHIPRLFSKICTLNLMSGCSMKVCVSGKRENKRGKWTGGPMFSDCQGIGACGLKSRAYY